MKLPTREELQGHDRATMRGAIEGTLGGLAVSIPASYILHRRWPYYRSLPLPLKALGVVLVTAPTFAIFAERRGVEYDKQVNWTDAGKAQMDRAERVEERRWEGMTAWEKVGDWAGRHQYQIVFGCWVASMAGSWMVLRRHKTESFGQKIVQARVYAQGATVATLLGAAFLTQRQRAEAAKSKGVDHSWRTFLDEQEREKAKLQTAVASS